MRDSLWKVAAMPLGERKRWPWRIWLLIVLFPIPFGIARWWITAGFALLFVVVVWAISEYYDD